MATYPAAVKSFTNKVDGVDYFYASDLNTAYDEITAVQSAIGVSPSVSVASTTGTFNAGTSVDYGTVKARLDNMELGVIKGAANAVQTTGGSAIQPSATNVIPLTLKGFAGTTVDLFSVQDSAAVARLKVSSTGATTLTNAIVQPTATNVIPLIVKGFASSTVDTLQIQDSSGSTKIKVDSNQTLTLLPPNVQAPSLTISGLGSPLQTATPFVVTSVNTPMVYVDNTYRLNAANGVSASTATASGIPLISKGAASQTASLFEVQDSTGAAKLKVDNTGQLFSQGNQTPFKISAGTSGVTFTAGATFATATVSLTGFSVAPIVQLTIVYPSGGIYIQATSVTSTTISVQMNIDSGTGGAGAITVPFHWTAIQGTSSAAAL